MYRKLYELVSAPPTSGFQGLRMISRIRFLIQSESITFELTSTLQIASVSPRVSI